MIQINQLKLPVSHTENDITLKLYKMLRIHPDALLSYSIKKRSLDARKKPDLYYSYTILAHLSNETAVKKRVKNNQILFDIQEKTYDCKATGIQPLTKRPIIIGTGPAGLFCGYQLARLGYRPILLEQGANVEQRLEDVKTFWETGVLSPTSNVQFGEGGAGTFSDGKLNTLVKDPNQRNSYVLNTFVQFGAPQEILFENKPHIGTDVLAMVVKNMRKAIECAGGEVRFHSKAVDFLWIQDGTQPKIQGIQVLDLATSKEYELSTDTVVLAIGHSARETFALLDKNHVMMEAKSFAVGVRVEHPQKLINEDQYGNQYEDHYTGLLAPADYKLAATVTDGRGVYTFCMCPGGYIINASSEKERLAINGMSYHNRAGIHANSAVIVTVSPADFEDIDALAGIAFQQALEEKAYALGKGQIPVQLFGDFKRNVASEGHSSIQPQTKGKYHFTNVRSIFPAFLGKSIEDGITLFGQKVKGFDQDTTIISGVESRTSSPVRILRDNEMQSNIKGLYPCGEGAGYAGGITSAAMDGLKVAEEIAKIYEPFDKDNECLRNF